MDGNGVGALAMDFISRKTPEVGTGATRAVEPLFDADILEEPYLPAWIDRTGSVEPLSLMVQQTPDDPMCHVHRVLMASETDNNAILVAALTDFLNAPVDSSPGLRDSLARVATARVPGETNLLALLRSEHPGGHELAPQPGCVIEPRPDNGIAFIQPPDATPASDAAAAVGKASDTDLRQLERELYADPENTEVAGQFLFLLRMAGDRACFFRAQDELGRIAPHSPVFDVMWKGTLDYLDLLQPHKAEATRH